MNVTRKRNHVGAVCEGLREVRWRGCNYFYYAKSMQYIWANSALFCVDGRRGTELKGYNRSRNHNVRNNDHFSYRCRWHQLLEQLAAVELPGTRVPAQFAGRRHQDNEDSRFRQSSSHPSSLHHLHLLLCAGKLEPGSFVGDKTKKILSCVCKPEFHCFKLTKRSVLACSGKLGMNTQTRYTRAQYIYR